MNYREVEESLKQLKNFILDIIFPIECLGCEREGLWLCPDCFKKIDLIDKFTCPICGKGSPWARVCPSCQGDSFLDGLWASASYNQGLLQRLIHTYKYNFVSDLAQPLGQLLIKFLNKLIDFKNKKLSNLLIDGLDNYKLEKILDLPPILVSSKETLLIPVPLHKRRLKERGFNQAELLAIELNKYFGFKLENRILNRHRYTTPQIELSEVERKLNVEGAFSYLNPLRIRNQSIILIDDVFTTGATMQECAKILKQAGAAEVWGLVLARG